MRSKRLVAKYMVLATVAALSLSACGGSKKADEPVSQETEVTQETEDPFAINGTEGIAITPTEETEVAIAEITETQANGLRAGKLTNGDGFIEMNEPGALGDTDPSAETEDTADTEDGSVTAETVMVINGQTLHVEGLSDEEVEALIEEAQSSEKELAERASETAPETEAQQSEQGGQSGSAKELAASAQQVMTEDELTTYDVVVTFWCEHPDMSEEYLTEMLGSAERFSSLSDEQRAALIEEVKTTYPHAPEETKAYATYWEQ